MNLIWYLIIFGIDYKTSQRIPEPSREVCIQQGDAYELHLANRGYSNGVHAYCVQGLPEGETK